MRPEPSSAPGPSSSAIMAWRKASPWVSAESARWRRNKSVATNPGNGVGTLLLLRRPAGLLAMTTHLFDHCVGAAEQRQRHGKTQRLGCLEIDNELHFGRLLNGQIRWLLAFENPSRITAGLTLRIGQIRSIPHYAAVNGEVAAGNFKRR